MAEWLEQSLAQGAVLTRAAHTLGDGEFQSAQNVRYKRGDSAQLHRDVSFRPHATTFFFGNEGAETTEFVDFAYMGVEADEDWLIAKRIIGGRTALFYTQANAGRPNWRSIVGPSSDSALNSIERRSDYLDIVHLGGQFLLGYGGTGVVLKDLTDLSTIHEIGMLPPEEAYPNLSLPYATTWSTSVVTGSALWYYPEGRKHIFMHEEPGLSVTIANGTPWDRNMIEDLSEDEYSWFLYYFTEYDQENDVESLPYAVQLFVFDDEDNSYVRQHFGPVQAQVITYSTGFPQFDFTNYVKKNARTTHVRLYRMALGTFLRYRRLGPFDLDVVRFYSGLISDKAVWKAWRANGTPTDPYRTHVYTTPGFPLGGMTTELELDNADEVVFKDVFEEPADGGGRAWDYYLNAYRQRNPQPWDMGMHFQNTVVLNNLDEPTVLQYAIPGEPEYFPAPNVLPIVTAGEDEILAMHRVGDYAMIITRDNVHRLNYLPSEDDPPHEPLDLVSTEGGVSRHASCVVTLPQGTALVWLSSNQLNMSSGDGSINVCEDFSTAAAGLSSELFGKAVLYNNYKAGRIELWANTKKETDQVVYHFYYTRDHIKGSGFKLLGPHAPLREEVGIDADAQRLPVLSAVTATGQDRASELWLLTPKGTYLGNAGFSTDNIRVKFPRLIGRRDPNTRISIMRQGLYHTPTASLFSVGESPNRFYMRYGSKSRNAKAVEGKRVFFTNTSRDEEWDSNMVRGVSGNWIDMELVYENAGDLSFGPMMFHLEVSADAS